MHRIFASKAKADQNQNLNLMKLFDEKVIILTADGLEMLLVGDINPCMEM